MPMFFLIAVWGSANREYAAIKFILYTHVRKPMRCCLAFQVVGLYLKA